MKISKMITLPIELTSEEKDAIDKVQDLLGELINVIENNYCNVVGCKDTGHNLNDAELLEIFKKLNVLNSWELEIYNE